MKYILLFFLICGSLCPSWTNAEVYSTHENMEPDKCACAWVIKRFVDKNADFKFYAKGEFITEGIPFDAPEAEIRRYHNMSAFEYVIKKHDLTDSALQKIGKIIHDIEINYWGKKESEESQKVIEEIRKITENSKTSEEILKKCFVFFDDFYDILIHKGDE